MQKYINNVQDTFGNAVSGVTVTIRTNPGGVLATIYSDDGVTTKSNPFTNDSDGEFFFYAADGRYDIELTGPITETKADIRLLDIRTTATKIVVNTDIVTATPPTTEAVTGTYEIFDLDDTDQLARIGFIGDNDLRVVNQMRGGAVTLLGRDASGNQRNLVSGDPDAAVNIYHAGLIAAITVTGGIEVRSVGNTDAEGRYVRLAHQDGTDRGLLGHTSDTTLTLRNQIHGGLLTLTGENTASGAVKTFVACDPDGGTTIYHAASGTSILRATTNTTGRFNINSDGNTDAEQRSLNLCHQDQTVRSSFGNVSGTELIARNLIHGGPIQLSAEDAGGNQRIVFDSDPDVDTVIRGDNDVRLIVGMTGASTGETAVDCVVNGAVTLYYDNVSALQTRSGTTGHLSRAQVKHSDGNFYDIGLCKMPIFEQDANDDLDNTNQHFFIHKDAGGAVTFELQNTSNIQTGTMWMISNEDTEDITINATTNTCTLRWFDGGGVAPPTGNRTLAEAGVCTIIKYGVAEYFIWGIGLS